MGQKKATAETEPIMKSLVIIALFAAFVVLANAIPAPRTWGWRRIRIPVPPKVACPKPSGGMGICVEECSSNKDCKRGQLCCSNGCGHTCMAPAPAQADSACSEKPTVTGHCKAAMPRYTYSKGKCVKFIYGGCGGTANNFRSLRECQKKCMGM